MCFQALRAHFCTGADATGWWQKERKAQLVSSYLLMHATPDPLYQTQASS